MEILFYFRIVLVLIFVIVKTVYDFIRKIKWRISGLSNQILEIQRKRNMDKAVAQVETILFRYKADIIVQAPGEENFITSFCQFVKPEYILKPNVSLYNITPNEAIFVECDENVDVYSLDEGGVFLNCSQYIHAKKLIKLPLWAFLALAKNISKPKKGIAFVNMTLRCGSTLLLRILEATKKCLVISEPATFNVEVMLENRVPHEIHSRLLESVINILCKNLDASDKDVVVFKLTPLSSCSVSKTYALYPGSKYLFLYRKGVDVIKSACWTLRITPWFFLIKWLCFLSDDVYDVFTRSMAVRDVISRRCFSYYEMGCLAWGAGLRKYRKMREEEGIPVSAVRYEDMLKDREYVMKHIFKFFCIDYSADIVDKEYSMDAQRMSPFSISNVRQHDKPMVRTDFSEKDIGDMRKLCEALQITDFQEDTVLPGTIGHRAKEE